ncbi:KPN_02809 family neutral zinc metallopeptidase [Uliginosibacterium sp. H1]|uniref:KPN_02809 family neutral zinc metallopeptidase n=1 Tax=Uliginosibacterium sp. H1 TaxID=3114757 RepID=UPI002E1985EC|nr:neutral zinc metallopeptidase [Uliginosibacterium sp. H1]
MRFDDGQESSNIEDRRSSGRGLPVGGRSIGVGTVVLALVAWYFGIDPSVVMQGASMLDNQPPAVQQGQQGVQNTGNAQEDQLARFVSLVLRDTEQTWQQIFAQGGKQYADPKLVLFRDATQTACGTGQAAMGPFYCPADSKVYLDLGFFEELQRRFRAPGDFAQAYVIAHEVGHHVQNLLGISEQVHRARQRMSEAEGNALSVRQELQADCFAGVWAHHANAARQVLESGDVAEALAAATAIGDDTLQRQSQGRIVPESFTHGSSEQRVRWFRRGLDGGNVEQCNTFKAASL